MTNEEREALKTKMAARQQTNTGNMNSNQKTCSGCGSVIPANYDVCPVCGTVLRRDVKTKVYNHVEDDYDEDNDKGRKFAIASLVLGIVGVVTSLIINLAGVPGLACGVIGILAAKWAKQDGYKSGLRTAGFVLSIISAALGGISLLVMFWVYVLVGNMMDAHSAGYEGTKTINQLGGGAVILVRSLFGK